MDEMIMLKSGLDLAYHWMKWSLAVDKRRGGDEQLWL